MLKGNTNKDKNIWITFLASLAPRIIFIIFALPMRVPSDEISTLAGAAYLAGLDWQNATKLAGYYGVGFTSIFAPLLGSGLDSITVYRIILVVLSILQSLIAPIAYIIMKNYFKVTFSRFRVFIAISASYLVAITTVYVYNEHVLILLTWIIVCILLKLHKERERKKAKTAYTILLIAVLVYSMTVHTRAITFWGGVALVILMYFVVYRQWLVSLPICILSGGAGYILAKVFINWSVDTIWITDDIRNTTIAVTGAEVLVTDARSWTSWINIILGQINTGTIFSGGILLVSVLIGIWFILKAICKNDKQFKENEQTGYYYIITVFSLSTMAVTIFGQSLSWLGGVYSSMVYQDYGNPALRAITYLRYFMAYAGPLFVMGISYLYKNRERVKNIAKLSFVIAVCLQIYWATSIVPYIANNEDTKFYFMGFSPEWLTNGPSRIRIYLCASVVLIIMMLCIYLLYQRKHWTIIGVMLCLFFVYEYAVCAIQIINVEKTNFSYVDASYELLKTINDKEVDAEIYVTDTQIQETGQSKYCIYQFLFPRYEIKDGLPEDEEEVLVLSENPLDKEIIEEKNLEEILLDDNEYLYVRGEGLLEELPDK